MATSDQWRQVTISSEEFVELCVKSNCFSEKTITQIQQSVLDHNQKSEIDITYTISHNEKLKLFIFTFKIPKESVILKPSMNDHFTKNETSMTYHQFSTLGIWLGKLVVQEVEDTGLFAENVPRIQVKLKVIPNFFNIRHVGRSCKTTWYCQYLPDKKMFNDDEHRVKCTSLSGFGKKHYMQERTDRTPECNGWTECEIQLDDPEKGEKYWTQCDNCRDLFQ